MYLISEVIKTNNKCIIVVLHGNMDQSLYENALM